MVLFQIQVVCLNICVLLYITLIITCGYNINKVMSITTQLTSALAQFWWSSIGYQRGVHWLAWKKYVEVKRWIWISDN